MPLHFVCLSVCLSLCLSLCPTLYPSENSRRLTVLLSEAVFGIKKWWTWPGALWVLNINSSMTLSQSLTSYDCKVAQDGMRCRSKLAAIRWPSVINAVRCYGASAISMSSLASSLHWRQLWLSFTPSLRTSTGARRIFYREGRQESESIEEPKRRNANAVGSEEWRHNLSPVYGYGAMPRIFFIPAIRSRPIGRDTKFTVYFLCVCFCIYVRLRISQPGLYGSAWNFAWRFGLISDRFSPI